jgi:hypothetical protein
MLTVAAVTDDTVLAGNAFRTELDVDVGDEVCRARYGIERRVLAEGIFQRRVQAKLGPGAKAFQSKKIFEPHDII